MITRDYGKQNQRHCSKSNRRKLIKSPINIRDKIKELEEKMEKEAIYKGLLRKQRQNQQEGPHLIRNGFEQVNRIVNSSPKAHQRTKPLFHSIEKVPVNKELCVQRQRTTPKQHPNYLTVNKPAFLTQKHSQKDVSGPMRHLSSQQQQQSLLKLKRQNQKFKKIFNQSIEKMQKLQKKLNQIKQQHQSQKHVLENTIEHLKQKIDQKKINLGHLYAYDDRGNNFLMVHQKIITQTDNQNSSSNAEFGDRKIRISPSFSNLSLQSK